MYNKTMNAAMFDEALEFARNYRTRFEFCGKMVHQFDRFGYLTKRQVEALVKMKRSLR